MVDWRLVDDEGVFLLVFLEELRGGELIVVPCDRDGWLEETKPSVSSSSLLSPMVEE